MKCLQYCVSLQNLFHRRVEKEQMHWSGLLEKCARLVKQSKRSMKNLLACLHHLGEEGVSARDTSTWFAKTILSSDTSDGFEG